MKPVPLLILLLWSVAAFGIDSEPPFADPTLQARYEALTHGFRCLVCQNETIADSNADLAGDLRRQVHELVASGKDDVEIRSYMVERYGDFVLYKPPVRRSTWLLWAGPFVLLLIALITVVTVVRRRARMEAGPGGAPP
jgi:cytochrome c-type biogenesis protein CcmH